MTLQEAKSIARHLGLTLRKVRSGDYRVNFRIGRCGVMTTKEAFDIVLALATDNMVDEKEMPEMYKRQSEALEIIAEIAKYYGSRRKNNAGAGDLFGRRIVLCHGITHTSL